MCSLILNDCFTSNHIYLLRPQSHHFLFSFPLPQNSPIYPSFPFFKFAASFFHWVCSMHIYFAQVSSNLHKILQATKDFWEWEKESSPGKNAPTSYPMSTAQYFWLQPFPDSNEPNNHKQTDIVFKGEMRFFREPNFVLKPQNTRVLTQMQESKVRGRFWIRFYSN